MKHNIQLQPLQLDHADGYVALLSDPATAPYISEEGSLTREAALAKLERIALQNSASSAQTYLAVVDDASHEFLGYVAAHDQHAEICPISYAILASHRKRGVAKAAIHALLGHLAQHSSAEWIEARTHPENTASIVTLRSCGFIRLVQANAQTAQRIVFRRKI